MFRCTRTGVGALAAAILTLACAGGSPPEGPAPDPSGPAPSGGAGEGVAVPVDALRLVPEGVRARRVEAGEDPKVVHLDLRSVDAIEAWWTDHANVVVTGRTDTERVGAWWDDDRVRFAVAQATDPTTVTLRVYESVPSSAATTGPACASGKPVRAGWPDGGVLSTCVAAPGPGAPLGPFKVERYGIVVVEGAYDDQGQRTGVWTVRNDSGDAVVTGAYEAGVPVGGWMFSIADVEHQVLYVDGAPTELPFAQLPTAGADPRPWASARFDVLDADLAAGWVAASVRFRLAPDVASGAEPRDCPLLGRVDPKEGLILQLLQAGHRQPVAQWTVYDSTPAGGDCPTEDSAAAALAAATEAFRSKGLDPDRRPASIAPRGGADPFAGEVDLDLKGHTLQLRPGAGELSLEAQLVAPDLLSGSWRTNDRQVVRSAEVVLDQQPLDELWIRWPAECAGGAEVAGALASDAAAAVVFKSAACSGGGPDLGRRARVPARSGARRAAARLSAPGSAGRGT